jgi:TolB-like protein/class 3 adenylate cyclase
MATARAERRLAATMAADVTGYSRLVEADEAGTPAAIRDVRREVIEPLLSEHHGRIIKLMGDGAIPEFGSAVDAVACAVAVQKASPPGRLRPRRSGGSPSVSASILGMWWSRGEDLLGDGVNVAAGLEQLCEPRWSHAFRRRLRPPAGQARPTARVRGQAAPQESRSAATDLSADGVRPASSGRRARRYGWTLPTAAAALLAPVLAGVAIWWLWPGEPAFTGRPSIAALPFDNLGGDDATGRLADGITEDIITDLSRFRDFDVIARNSTTVYEDRPVDAHQVGKDLKVRYVLEGSIQKQDEQIRATAQLVHAATGAHVWSERWDRPARDLFAVQTEIAELVANQLGGWGVVLGASNFGHPNCGAGTADRALRLDPN